MRRHRRKYFPIRSGGCVLHFLLVPVLELLVCGHPHHYRASSSIIDSIRKTYYLWFYTVMQSVKKH